jgi:hypothetical protein
MTKAAVDQFPDFEAGPGNLQFVLKREAQPPANISQGCAIPVMATSAQVTPVFIETSPVPRWFYGRAPARH